MTIGTDKLPQGWKWVKVGDVCQIIRGVVFKKAQAKSIPAARHLPVLRAGNITDKLRTDDDLVWIPEELVSPAQKLKLGDIAMCISSGSASVVGKTAMLRSDWNGTIGGFCAIIRAESEQTGQFLGYWFRSHQFLAWRDSQARGSNIQNLRTRELSKYKVPLPPLCEQQRIAGILNQQMAYVEKARQAAEEILEAAQALPGAFLRQAFPAHGEALPAGWRWVKLKEVGVFKSGGTPSKKRADYWHGEIPFVTGADITELYISKGNARAFLTREGFDSGKTVVCKSGTVLIVTRTRVGRIGIAQEAMGASQDITAFECGDQINQEFLYWYLHKNSDHLIDNSRGSTIQGLTRKFVANIRIPLPPLSEQKRIAALLNQQMAYVETVRMSAREQLDAINALPAALLRRAFAGGL